MDRHFVLAVVDDMFFSSKIEAVARGLGFDLVEVRDARSLEESLVGHPPRLILLDLNCRGCPPLDAIGRIRRDDRLRDIPLVAFFSHVQVGLERAAREAGCETVLPRSKFSVNLREILSGGEPADG